MILKEFIAALAEEAGTRRADGPRADGLRPVRGLAVEEIGVDPWLGPDEIPVTARKQLDAAFLDQLAHQGCPALIWRSAEEFPEEVIDKARESNMELLAVPPDLPLSRILSLSFKSNALLMHSHGAVRALFSGSGSQNSMESLLGKLASLLGRAVAVEDSVGRLLASAGPDGNPDGQEFVARLEENELRASRSSIDETRREQRDRYARLPDGFVSVPIERWRVADREFFWTPVGSGAPAGYLWMDIEERALAPEDVVLLFWARQLLENEMDKERVRLETELGIRGDFVDDLISGHYGSMELLLQRAGYLGAELSQGALVLVVDIDNFARYLERRKLKEPAIQELKKRLADAVRLQTRELFSNFLIGPRSDNVIVFLAPSDDAPADKLAERSRTLAARIQRYVKGLLPDLTVSVGIGRYRKEPEILPDAYSEAEVALEIGHRIHGPSSISTFEETGTYKLLFRVLQEDPQELTAFYKETLGPIVAYDSRYGTDLVGTLITYLKNDSSTAKTAAELFAHRHTIRYRLDRVRELTNLDVEKSEDRERITLGIKAMQLLGRSPDQSSSFTDR